jgi:hypothetical protein
MGMKTFYKINAFMSIDNKMVYCKVPINDCPHWRSCQRHMTADDFRGDLSQILL